MSLYEDLISRTKKALNAEALAHTKAMQETWETQIPLMKQAADGGLSTYEFTLPRGLTANDIIAFVKGLEPNLTLRPTTLYGRTVHDGESVGITVCW